MTDEAASSTAGWYPDPIGRFELRFHNGRDWTADVASAGQRYVDPAGILPNPAGGTSGPGSGSSGMATASMVLGIIAVSIAWMPFIVVLGVVIAVIALVFGVVAHRRAAHTSVGRSRAVAGLVLGACALLASMIGLALTVIVLDVYNAYVDPADHEARVTECTMVGSRAMVTGEITNLDDATADFTIAIDVSQAAGSRNAVELHGTIKNVAPGATETFELQRQVPFDDVVCTLVRVRGPLPFGVDLD